MNYLFVGAHLDDVELAAGGLIAKVLKNGHKAKIVCLSKSSYSDWKGNVLRTEEQAISEGMAAADILGCELEIFDFPTKDIPFHSSVIEAIEKQLYGFNADIIFTHNINDTHQAHVGAAKSTLAAARRFNTVYFYEPLYPSGRSPIPFNPDVYVDISDFIDKKIEALKKHDSQYQKYSKDWIEAIKARAKYRGYENGMEYAECFEVCRMELRVDQC